MNFFNKQTPAKKIALIVLLFILIIVGVFGIWGVANAKNGQVLMNDALAGKQSLENAQAAITKQDFVAAQADLQAAKTHFNDAQNGLKKFGILKFIPVVNTQLKAADQMVIAAASISSGLEKVAGIGASVTAVLSEKKGDVSFADIKPEDKAKVLKVLSESTVDLQGVQADLQLAQLAIEGIPTKGLIGPIHDAVAPIQEQLPLLQSVITQAIPLAQSLPSILGYPGEKKYLFLLQNNNELRPTGGFIGTYGILKVKDGEIVDFFTDNIYNLDNKAKDRVTEPSPAPLAQRTSTKNWLMRNINWDPHFPATAVKAEQKYEEESETQENFDGVIAVTPRFIASLLGLTGPITIEDTKFTSENLAETLQHKTEFSYESDGKTDATRKEIIGVLANSLIDQLFQLPKSKLPEIWKTFTKNVDEKHILLYVKDPLTQQLIVQQNWAGEMKPYTSDFISVIDANLAALKTDRVMKRSLDYHVEKNGNEYIATATMTYKNEAQAVTFFETRYLTETRFYIPAGSKVLESSGFVTGHKGKSVDPSVTDTVVTQADGTDTYFTVVEGYLVVEPKDTKTLTVKYTLPESVVNTITKGNYSLLVQKQAGTIAHGLHATFDIGRGIKAVQAVDMTAKIEDNKASIDGDLRIDRHINIDLK